jgi:hypothetical protein
VTSVRDGGSDDAVTDDATIRLWIDKLTIRELIERSVRFIDDQDGDAVAVLSEEDNVLQLAGRVFAGRDELRTMFPDGPATHWTTPGALLVQPGSTHLTSNPVIDVDGDRATAETDMVTLVRGEGKRTKITLLARSRDRLRRAPAEEWRLSSRTGVSIGTPAEIGTDAEWARALERMPSGLRAQFRPEG